MDSASRSTTDLQLQPFAVTRILAHAAIEFGSKYGDCDEVIYNLRDECCMQVVPVADSVSAFVQSTPFQELTWSRSALKVGEK